MIQYMSKDTKTQCHKIIRPGLEKMTRKKKYITTFTDITMHVVMTVALAWVFYIVTGGWLWPLLAVLGGILIDVDHFLDYFFHYRFKFSAEHFLCNTYLESGKSYVIFHSWEIVFILLGFSYVISWLYPIALSMAIHILWDQLTFGRIEPYFYFLTYRWYHGFDLKKISPRRFYLFHEKGF